MSEFRVMTSGAFTAAHLALMPQLARRIGTQVVTASTSIGTGENSISSRLQRAVNAGMVAPHVTHLHQEFLLLRHREQRGEILQAIRRRLLEVQVLTRFECEPPVLGML